MTPFLYIWCVLWWNERMKSSFDTSDEFALTDEQQAVVAHDFGPALVFAVAGAGKTTSMVHRIARLVNERIVPAHRILATSFNRANVDELKVDLAQMSIAGTVNCRTLHSLGFTLIRAAVRKGYVERSWLDGNNFDKYGNALIMRTIIALSREEEIDSSQLDLDREELENQISIWKNNLVYPDLKKSGLPPEAKKLATQAKHENSLYVRAYQIYEEERKREHWITFDDMLMTGWELLVTFPDLCEEVQNSYDMVLVDEFQDLNLSQYEMLSMIVAKHKNYMAIGDDDQCIYEWRGASPRFILGFEKEFAAKVYTISDNFRCTAQQTMLANSVISCNKSRYDKLLNLTRGFGGNTLIKQYDTDGGMARHTVDEIISLLQSGTDVNDIVILIRLYSQTAFLEAELIEHNVSYDVVGNAPFYERHELSVLFKYLAWAMQEAEIKQNGYPYDARQRDKYIDRFKSIINTPRRYVSNAVIGDICNQSMGTGRSILDILNERAGDFKHGTKHKIFAFLKISRVLIKRVSGDDSASAVLSWLIKEIEYEKHLLDVSGVRETGMTKVQTVEVLKNLAKGKGSSREFLNHIVHMSMARKQAQGSTLKIMTMYRAKGLEWSHVFIPGVNMGLMPFGMNYGDLKQKETQAELEAERRLFYVGMTRSKQNLYLYHSKEQPVSSFLTEVAADRVLDNCSQIAGWLNGTAQMGPNELIDLAMKVNVFSLKRYFKKWAQLDDKFRQAFISSLNGMNTIFDGVDESNVEELLLAGSSARKIQSDYFVHGIKALCKALDCEFDEDHIVDLKGKTAKILNAVKVFDRYLNLSQLASRLEVKQKLLVKSMLSLGWLKAAADHIVLSDAGRAAGGITMDGRERWAPCLLDNSELAAAISENRPVTLSGYFSTTKLAWELGIEDYQLFEYLVTIGWLMKHGIKHVLTPLGEKKGGKMRKSRKGKKTVVWPPDITSDEAFAEFV